MAGLNFVTFNQDHSLLAVATTRGLRVYTTDPFELTHHSYEEDIALVEQLFSTSLVALILTPRLLRIVNTRKHSTICELTFHGMVVAVKMNRKRLVVMLEEVVFIYDISNMKLLHQQTTPLNPAGIVAISPHSERNYLALPHHQKAAATPSAQQQQQQQASHVPRSIIKDSVSGDVLLYDLGKMEEVTIVRAHQTALSCVAINNDGTLLATASEKGTVIRIFSIPEGKKLFQFRRGSMPARIYCMSFNATSTLLCVSSATETIHIFKLSPPNGPSSTSPSASSSSRPTSPSSHSSHLPRDRSASPSTPPSEDPSASYDPTEAAVPPPPRPQQGFMSLLRRTSQGVSASLVTRAAGYLPASVTEMWEPQRDFAWVRLPPPSPSSGGAGGGNKGPGGGGGGGGSSPPAVRSVVAMANSVPHVLVATSEGEFLVYSVDLDRGGEGTLVRRFDDVHGWKHRKGGPDGGE